MKNIAMLIMLLLLAIPVQADVELEFWQFWTDPTIKPILQEIVSEFEEANPDIKVNLTDLTWSNGHEKIVIAFASGTAPDILELGSDWIAQFAANGHLADISDLVAPVIEDNRGWSMAQYDNTTYARPWFLGTRVIFYNKDLLNQTDIGEDFVLSTWDMFKSGTMKVDSLGEKIYGWGSNVPEKHRLYKKYLPFFWTEGAQIYSDSGDLTVIASTRAVEAMNKYKYLHDSCGFVGTQRQIDDAFLDGKIGFILSGDWLLKRIELESRKIDFGTAMFPGPKYPGKSFLGGEFLAVTKSSKQKEAAYRFIDWLTSPANQIKFCKANRSATPASITASKDEYFESSPHLRVFNRQVFLSKHPPVDPNWVEIEAIIESVIERSLFGDGLTAEALKSARYQIEQLKTR